MSVHVDKTTTVSASVSLHWQGGGLRSSLKVSRRPPHGPLQISGTGTSGSVFTLEMTNDNARDLAHILLEICDWQE